jgi:hypothetical protein
MKFTRSIVVAFSLIFLSISGCAHIPDDRVYVGTVERFEMPEGSYFTTKDGSAPMNYLYLRINKADSEPANREIEVQILAIYDVGKYGKPGDVVSFRCRKLAPGVGTVVFEDLVDYKIAASAPVR